MLTQNLHFVVIFSIFQQAFFVVLCRFSLQKEEVLPKIGNKRLKRTSISFGAKSLSLSLSKAIVSNPIDSLGLTLSIYFQV